MSAFAAERVAGCAQGGPYAPCLHWLGEFSAHHVRNGPDPDALPERDFSATSWQCRSCPFLAVCLPGAAEVGEETEVEE